MAVEVVLVVSDQNNTVIKCCRHYQWRSSIEGNEVEGEEEGEGGGGGGMHDHEVKRSRKKEAIR